VLGDQFRYLFRPTIWPFVVPAARLTIVQTGEPFVGGRLLRPHGARSIVLARFVPVVGTFTPIVAGASGMHYRRFAVTTDQHKA
jgi:membrane-associated protein